MHRRIRIRLGDLALSATLTHSSGAAALWEQLPVRGEIKRLPGEIALRLAAPLSGTSPPTGMAHAPGMPPPAGMAPPDTLPALREAPQRRTELGIGELAYREQTATLSLFHAATPASLRGEPRADVPVLAVGMLEQEPFALEPLPDGATFLLERYEG